jgi:acrylyl-CoA reductase (NADPH)/3-hydroxypropionyl-CoA dehydratase/3-hydroxypropionyl-CoA synthetase
MGLAVRQRVTGIVSSEARRRAVEELGAGAINRKEVSVAGCFTRVPEDAAAWKDWQRRGQAFIDAVRRANDSELVDYAVSHAGETAFPRSFQALAPGGRLTFYGASSGYHLTFIGKPGTARAEEMMQRAGLRPGEAVVVFYGSGGGERDRSALAAIEAAREAGGRIVVVTDDDAERDFVLSLGFGDAVLGALSLAEIGRRSPQFRWLETMPELPDPQSDTAAFKAAVRRFNDEVFKPLATTAGRLLRSADNPRGMPEVVVERANRDSLAVSTMLVKPNTGRVVFTGDMGGRRYSFYAPQVWMRQRRILMPTAEILGTHLCNAAEVAGLNRMIDAGMVRVEAPYLGAWAELPEMHQAMSENRLPEYANGAAKAVVNHALPEAGLKHRNDLLVAWAEALERSADGGVA